jgi:hypothetical protein
MVQMQPRMIEDVLNALSGEHAGAPHNAMDHPSLLQQFFRQIGPILSRDACHQCNVHLKK